MTLSIIVTVLIVLGVAAFIYKATTDKKWEPAGQWAAVVVAGLALGVCAGAFVTITGYVLYSGVYDVLDWIGVINV